MDDELLFKLTTKEKHTQQQKQNENWWDNLRFLLVYSFRRCHICISLCICI